MKLRFGIITASDRSARKERPDASGPALAQRIRTQGWEVTEMIVLPDDFTELRDRLASWSDGGGLDVILVTGGTGFAPRDITPEATLAVVEKVVPGLPEAMRAASLQITPHAMLSRLVAGIRRRTLIINLPGSPRGALENFEVVIPVLDHAIQLLSESPDAEAGH
jgi:molybdopterin adenylyltransferase